MGLGQISPMCCFNLKREAVIKPIANPNPSCEAWIFQDWEVGSEVFKPLGEVNVFNGEGSETESIWFLLLGRRQTPKWCHCLLLPASPQMMVELKWFTPQFSIPELKLHFKSKSILIVRTRHNPSRKMFSWRSSKTYATFEEKNNHHSVFTLSFYSSVSKYLIYFNNSLWHQKKESNENLSKVPQYSRTKTQWNLAQSIFNSRMLNTPHK